MGGVGPQGTPGATGATGSSGPAGPTASAFLEGSTALPGSGSTTVVSFTIAPAFAGNLLVQASGTVSYGSTSGASCQAFVGTTFLGSSTTTVGASATAESISVTGAGAVAAGTYTVSIKCSTIVGSTTPTVSLTAFALMRPMTEVPQLDRARDRNGDQSISVRRARADAPTQRVRSTVRTGPTTVLLPRTTGTPPSIRGRQQDLPIASTRT